MKTLKLLLIIILITVSSNAAVFSQFDEALTVSGTVVSVSPGFITLEYADEFNQTQHITLGISEDIELFEVSDVAEIVPGEDVTLDYIHDDQGNDVVISLYKF